MSDATVWVAIGSGFSLVLSFLLDIGLLVVALVFVRKRSGTAAWLMAAAAGVYMLSAIAQIYGRE